MSTTKVPVTLPPALPFARKVVPSIVNAPVASQSHPAITIPALAMSHSISSTPEGNWTSIFQVRSSAGTERMCGGITWTKLAVNVSSIGRHSSVEPAPIHMVNCVETLSPRDAVIGTSRRAVNSRISLGASVSGMTSWPVESCKVMSFPHAVEFHCRDTVSGAFPRFSTSIHAAADSPGMPTPFEFAVPSAPRSESPLVLSASMAKMAV